MSPYGPLSVIFIAILFLIVAGLVIKIEELKAERRRVRAEEDKKYENQVMYDGKALSWLDGRISRVRNNIEHRAYNTVRKSGRKLVKISDMHKALKRFIKR